MTTPSYEKLTTAIDNFLGNDDSANVLIVERKNGPEMSLLRTDALEVMRMKAAKYDAASKGSDEDGRDKGFF
jgi:hypothetical protein